MQTLVLLKRRTITGDSWKIQLQKEISDKNNSTYFYLRKHAGQTAFEDIPSQNVPHKFRHSRLGKDYTVKNFRTLCCKQVSKTKAQSPVSKIVLCKEKILCWLLSYCSRSQRRAAKADKRMFLVHTHGLFIT